MYKTQQAVLAEKTVSLGNVKLWNVTTYGSNSITVTVTVTVTGSADVVVVGAAVVVGVEIVAVGVKVPVHHAVNPFSHARSPALAVWESVGGLDKTRFNSTHLWLSPN